MVCSYYRNIQETTIKEAMASDKFFDGTLEDAVFFVEGTVTEYENKLESEIPMTKNEFKLYWQAVTANDAMFRLSSGFEHDGYRQHGDIFEKMVRGTATAEYEKFLKCKDQVKKDNQRKLLPKKPKAKATQLKRDREQSQLDEYPSEETEESPSEEVEVKPSKPRTTAWPPKPEEPKAGKPKKNLDNMQDHPLWNEWKGLAEVPKAPEAPKVKIEEAAAIVVEDE